MRTRGIREVVSLAAARAREAVHSEDALVVLVRPTGATGSASPAEGLKLRALAAPDAELYARAIGTDSPGTFRERLSSDTTCYVVEDGSRVVHASWVTSGCPWTREVRAYLCPPRGDAYVYESFTSAGARGRGVYPFALAEICRALAEEGFGRLWVAVEAHNGPSLRAVAKAGFERVYTIRYGRRLGRLWLVLPDGVKRDRTGAKRRKKNRIWLSRDGAM